MSVGFKTSQSSIYILDPEGRTSRYKASDGRGQGEWHPESHCVFAHPKDELAIKDARASHERVSLTYFAEGKGLTLPYSATGETLPRPSGCDHVGVCCQNRATGDVTLNVSASAVPKIGFIPVEKSYASPTISETHIGHPITKVFETVTELRVACRDAGLTKVPLPAQYVQEWQEAKAHDASMAASANVGQQAGTVTPLQLSKTNFAKQVAAQAAQVHADPAREGMNPAKVKIRPQQGYVITR